MKWWGGRVGVDVVAGVRVDMPSNGGMGVDMVEVEASVVERVLFFFSRCNTLLVNY